MIDNERESLVSTITENLTEFSKICTLLNSYELNCHLHVVNWMNSPETTMHSNVNVVPQ